MTMRQAPCWPPARRLAGTPAIVIPTGLTKDKLPTAIQIDGRAYSENRLLALAVAYQNATAWHREHPEFT